MLTTKAPFVSDSPKFEEPLFRHYSLQAGHSGPPPATDFGGGRPGGEPEACKLVSVNLSAYLDNELDADQAQLVTNHLDDCADCAALLHIMEDADIQTQREWREDTPLPSSSQFKHSIDSIMGALPPESSERESFAPKRVHSRIRWIRLATGLSGILLAVGMLWSSYTIGYARGRSTNSGGHGYRSERYLPPTESLPVPSLIALFSTSSRSPQDSPGQFGISSHGTH